MDHNIDEVCRIVETWQQMRTDDSTKRDLTKFVEINNNMSRRLIAALNSKQDPEFWTALMELASNCQTIVTPQAKIFVDGLDRTNL